MSYSKLSPSLPRLGWPHLCPAGHASSSPHQPRYLISPSTSPASTVHARPLLLPLHPTKPDHVLPCHLCLQAPGSPKPRRLMPQVCAPSKPAFQCCACHAQLAEGMPCRYHMVWTPSFVDSYLLYLASPDTFALRHPFFSFLPFCLRLTALHSPPSPFILVLPPDHLLCPPLTWLSCARYSNYHLFRFFLLLADITAIVLAVQVPSPAGSTSRFSRFCPHSSPRSISLTVGLQAVHTPRLNV
jgi:hypothetical protein